MTLGWTHLFMKTKWTGLPWVTALPHLAVLFRSLADKLYELRALGPVLGVVFFVPRIGTHTHEFVCSYMTAAMDPSLCPVSIWWVVSSTRNMSILVSLVAANQWQKHSENPIFYKHGMPWNSRNLLSLKDGEGLVLFWAGWQGPAAFMRCYGEVPTRKIKSVSWFPFNAWVSTLGSCLS